MTQTVPDISPLMPMHQDPLLVVYARQTPNIAHTGVYTEGGSASVLVTGHLQPWYRRVVSARLFCGYLFNFCWWYQAIHTAIQKLTHWGWVTHICVGNLTIIGSDNGLSPGRYQAIFWNNAGILLIGPLGTNFSEILIEKLVHFYSRNCIWKCRQQNGGHFASASIC